MLGIEVVLDRTKKEEGLREEGGEGPLEYE